MDLVEIHYGFGRSMFYLNKHQLLEFGKYVYGEWIQTFATLMFTKVSICLFLLRIPVTKALIRPLQAAVAFLVVSNVVLTLMWIFQCTPVDAAWNSEKQSTSRCFSRGELQRMIMAQARGSCSWVVLPYRELTLVSHLHHLGLSLRCIPSLHALECANEVSDQIISMGFDGSWCNVSNLGHYAIFLPLLIQVHSTASCCMVRTVLNNESIPIDKTCGFSLSESTLRR